MRKAKGLGRTHTEISLAKQKLFNTVWITRTHTVMTKQEVSTLPQDQADENQLGQKQNSWLGTEGCEKNYIQARYAGWIQARLTTGNPHVEEESLNEERESSTSGEGGMEPVEAPWQGSLDETAAFEGQSECCQWKSAMMWGLWIQLVGIHDLSSGPYPSQLKKYWRPHLRHWEWRTHSTVYCDRFPIYEAWKQGERSSRALGTLMIDGMDLNGTRKFELNCCWVDDPLDLKWANKTGCHLLGVNL